MKTYGLFWLMVRYASNSWMKCWMLGVIIWWAAVQLANWIKADCALVV
jgi:hypothetical protein